MLKLLWLWPGASSNWLLFLFMGTHWSLSSSLLSDTRCPWLVLRFFCVRPWITISPSSSGSFLWGMIFRTQDPDTMYIHCHWHIVASEAFQWKEQGNTFQKSQGLVNNSNSVAVLQFFFCITLIILVLKNIPFIYIFTYFCYYIVYNSFIITITVSLPTEPYQVKFKISLFISNQGSTECNV